MTVTRAELGIDRVVEEGARRREGESVPFSSLFPSRQLSCVVQLPCLLHREEGATMRRARLFLCGISWQNLMRFYPRKSMKKGERSSVDSLPVSAALKECLSAANNSPVQNQPRILCLESPLPPSPFVRFLLQFQAAHLPAL